LRPAPCHNQHLFILLLASTGLTMLEYKESLISQLIIHNWMLWMLAFRGSLDVLNIWIDATDTEQKSFPTGSHAQNGLVYLITNTSTVVCGQRNNQKPIYPPMYLRSGIAIPLCGFRLQNVVFAAQNVILDLGPLWVQVSQLYILLVRYSQSDNYRFNYLLIQMHKSTHVMIGTRQSVRWIGRHVLQLSIELALVMVILWYFNAKTANFMLALHSISRLCSCFCHSP